jgi:hypothetical protein
MGLLWKKLCDFGTSKELITKLIWLSTPSKKEGSQKELIFDW